METRGRTPGGNGDGSGDGNESSCRNRNGNENKIGEGGREVKKRKKPHKNCRRHVGNGGDLGGKRKKRRKKRICPVAANTDNLESNKKAEVGAKTLQIETVCPLCRV